MIRTSTGALIPDVWEPHIGQTQDGFEIVHSPMWDTRTFTDNSSTKLTFFSATGAGASTDLTSNTFPLTDVYLLKAIGVFFKVTPFVDDAGAAGTFAASLWGDLAQIINTGWLDMGLGKKGYGPFPLWKLGAGGGLYGVLAASGGEAANLVHDYAQIGTPNTDGLFKLQVPLILPPTTSLPVTMNWPAAINTANGNIAICLYLDGLIAYGRG